MRTLTGPELAALLADAGGPPDVTHDPAVFMSTPFADLGYDSLAVLETLTLVQARWGVSLPDDVVAAATSPADLLVVLNRELVA